MVWKNILSVSCFSLPCFPPSNLTELFLVGGSTLADLHQALEDYLPVLLGLTKDGNILLMCSSIEICLAVDILTYIFFICSGSHLQCKVQFNWVNQEDEQEVREPKLFISYCAVLFVPSL